MAMKTFGDVLDEKYTAEDFTGFLGQYLAGDDDRYVRAFFSELYNLAANYLEPSGEGETDENVTKALDLPRDDTAEVMTELLMDDGVSTYGAFEDLASAYNGATPKERAAMNRVLTILLSYNMSEVAEQIVDRSESRRSKPATPCDTLDENGMSHCPYEGSGVSESEMCRVCCGLGVDE